MTNEYDNDRAKFFPEINFLEPEEREQLVTSKVDEIIDEEGFSFWDLVQDLADEDMESALRSAYFDFKQGRYNRIGSLADDYLTKLAEHKVDQEN